MPVKEQFIISYLTLEVWQAAILFGPLFGFWICQNWDFTDMMCSGNNIVSGFNGPMAECYLSGVPSSIAGSAAKIFFFV